MAEEQKNRLTEAVETGASTAQAIHGAIKTGKAVSAAAKGAAIGGPYGAAVGAVLAGRRHIGKIIAVIAIVVMLPVLFVLMLPGLLFGGLLYGGQSVQYFTGAPSEIIDIMIGIIIFLIALKDIIRVFAEKLTK